MVVEYIIIGAGMSGLNTARKIKEMNLGTQLILEKSRAIGGRMATRRTMNTKFDHGAQFYKLRPDFLDLHKLWLANNLTHQWFASEKGDHWCSSLGMTALAKSMVQPENILLEKQIVTIHSEDKLWKLTTSLEEKFLCKNLVITTPIPQAMRLLEPLISETKSLDKNALSDISKINYSKALVALVTLEGDSKSFPTGYQEFQTGDIFSIADQKKKNLGNIPALTITMSPEFSEKEFEQPEILIIENIIKSINRILPDLKIKELELKKWRYCKADSYYKDSFLELSKNLYLIGDAFGGPGLSGALRSSNTLCNFFLQNKSESQL